MDVLHISESPTNLDQYEEESEHEYGTIPIFDLDEFPETPQYYWPIIYQD